MTFIWPTMLLSLFSVPLLALVYLRREQRRRQWAARYGSLGFVPASDSRHHGLFALFSTGLAILCVALARPHMEISLPRVEGTLILAFDISGSMAANDVEPTRLDVAKAVAIEFVQRQPRTVQLGLVAFSEGGLSVQAPTNDQAALIAAINRLTIGRATSLANGILASLTVIAAQYAHEPPRFYSNLTPEPTATPTPVPSGTYNTSAIVVLFSDGENTTAPDPMDAVQAAIDRGIRVYTVGIGGPEGATLEVEGFSVHTQIDEAMLQDIAQRTGGKYYHVESQGDLSEIYDTVEAQWVVRPEKTEVTALFAVAGILLMLIGGALSLWWFNQIP
jgi:Ca-activated chloride channel family protein